MGRKREKRRWSGMIDGFVIASQSQMALLIARSRMPVTYFI